MVAPMCTELSHDLVLHLQGSTKIIQADSAEHSVLWPSTKVRNSVCKFPERRPDSGTLNQHFELLRDCKTFSGKQFKVIICGAEYPTKVTSKISS